MTMPRDERSRDPRLDAAWQAASREEPPTAIDSAIRAAARREVESGPHVIAEAQRIPRSRRRTWWPLAAAAAVAAITVGVMQTVPLEPNLTDTTVGTRQDAPLAPQAQTAPSPPGPMTHSPAPAVSPPEPPLPRDEAGQSARLAREPSGRFEASTEEKPASARPALRMPTQVPRQAPPRARADSNAGRPPTATQDSRSPGDARGQGAPSVMPPAAAGRIESPPPLKDGPRAFATSPPPPVVVAPQASPLAVPAESPDAARASPSRSAAARADTQADTVPLAKSMAASAERTPLAVPAFDDWVKTIQQLLRDGHRDDAQREIIRLRDAYPAREISLPPELRALLTPR